jgi:hypothetical protein
MTKVTSVKKGGKTVSVSTTEVLAAASITLAKGKSLTVKLALTPTGKSALASAAKNPLHLSIVMRVTGGATTSKSVVVS